MDESLRNAALAGSVEELYRLIQGNGNVLREIDEVEFTDSPLHIAAAEGCIDLAMEIMSLKPSFARKLNQDGLSPMHLAVIKGHKEMALRLLEIDGGLVRVRGKNGKTPLFYISEQGNSNGLLEDFLEACPESIRDVTAKNQTALHAAVEINNLDVVKVLLQALSNTEYRREVVNRKDQDGNTALHIAARNNQPQILQVLLKCKADKHLTNHAGLTAMEVAEQLGNRQIIGILLGSFIPGITPCLHKLQRGIVKYERKASVVIFKGMDNISSDDRNALLVILALLLTAAYQTSVTPPGGVWQDNGDDHEVGKSVMPRDTFLTFYIPTCAVFLVSLFLTLSLLKPYPQGFKIVLQVLLTLLAICFQISLIIILPTGSNPEVIVYFSFLVFILMAFMCIPNRVSKISVFILGYWFTPLGNSNSNSNPNSNYIAYVVFIILGFWLIFFMGNGLLQVAFLLIGYGLVIYVTYWFSWVMAIIVVGCCCFIKFCQLCLRRYNAYRYI